MAPVKSMRWRIKALADVGSGERRWDRGWRGFRRSRHLLLIQGDISGRDTGQMPVTTATDDLPCEGEGRNGYTHPFRITLEPGRQWADTDDEGH